MCNLEGLFAFGKVLYGAVSTPNPADMNTSPCFAEQWSVRYYIYNHIHSSQHVVRLQLNRARQPRNREPGRGVLSCSYKLQLINQHY